MIVLYLNFRVENIYIISQQLNTDVSSVLNLKDPPQIDKKFALMTRKDAESYKAHGELIKLDKKV